MAAELRLVTDETPGTNAEGDPEGDPGNEIGHVDKAQPLPFVAHRRPGRFASMWRRLRREDDGAVTAEYAIIILAGVAFAGVLVAIMRSDEVREMLVRLVENALGSAAT